MSYTTADLDALNRVIKSGAASVRFVDRGVTYRSMDELLKLRSLIESEIAAASGATRVHPRHQIASFADD